MRILALIFALCFGSVVSAQEQSPVEPIDGIWYLACSQPSNSATREFRNAAAAASELTLQQLRDPWAALRTHTTKDRLPRRCRHAVMTDPETTLYDARCVLSKDGQLVILREIEQGNGFFQVIIIADTQWLHGAPRICLRRRN